MLSSIGFIFYEIGSVIGLFYRHSIGGLSHKAIGLLCFLSTFIHTGMAVWGLAYIDSTSPLEYDGWVIGIVIYSTIAVFISFIAGLFLVDD